LVELGSKADKALPAQLALFIQLLVYELYEPNIAFISTCVGSGTSEKRIITNFYLSNRRYGKGELVTP